MTTEELLQAVDWIKVTMIAVATGGPRINEVNAEFAKKYDEVAEELASRGVKNTFPYRDLWQWYEHWSSGDMPSWQSRRSFVNGLADELILNIREASAGSITVATHEPTGWARVDRTVTEARKRLELATTEEQFQAVGLLCREILISLAQAVFDPERHPTLDGVRASKTDSPEAAMSTREGTQGRRVTSRFICSTNELPRFEKPPPALKLPLLRSISLPSWLAYETRSPVNTAVGWRDQSTHEWWGSARG